MRFEIVDGIEQGRALTAEEREAGIEWLERHGFADATHMPNITTVWYVKETNKWWIRASVGKSSFSAEVRLKGGRQGQVRDDGHSIGHFTTIEETIEDAKASCFRGLGEKEKAFLGALDECVQKVAEHWQKKLERRERRRRGGK